VGGKGRKRGQWGLGKGTKNEAVTLSMGPARAEVRNYLQRDTIPSKGLFVNVNIHKHHNAITFNICALCCKLQLNIYSPLQIKKNPRDGTCVYSWLNDLFVANITAILILHQ
jgi:hypothetical protein